MEYPYFSYRNRTMIVSQRVTIDYKHECILITDKGKVVESYPLESMRKYLWAEWESLVFRYRIKTILSKNRDGSYYPLTTFDWESIFLEACKNLVILEQYLNNQRHGNRKSR